jgi:hypothetical protein
MSAPERAWRYGFLMGRLRYDGISEPILIDDETLAHLKVIVGTKLRRQESFMMSWRPREGGDPGRVTVWVHPAIPLQFLYTSAEPQHVEKQRIEDMMRSLNATGELVIDDFVEFGKNEGSLVEE